MESYPVDSNGNAIKIGDKLQMNGREDDPLVVDGFVMLPTYTSKSVGRSCIVTRPDLWTIVRDEVDEDEYERFCDALYLSTNPCEYFYYMDNNRESMTCEKCSAMRSSGLYRCRADMVKDIVERYNKYGKKV